jgi:hypothetical protein
LTVSSAMLKYNIITGANSVGDDRIFRNGMKANERFDTSTRVSDDRIFRNGMEENERFDTSTRVSNSILCVYFLWRCICKLKYFISCKIFGYKYQRKNKIYAFTLFNSRECVFSLKITSCRKPFSIPPQNL